jgi:histidinol-phosphate aminotransferase
MTSPTLSPRLAALAAYKVPRHPAPLDLFLDGNEGLTPPSELLRWLAEAPIAAVRRYPSAAELEARLASLHQVDPARVMVTAGGDDAIDRLCRAVLHEGRSLLLPVPTFEMIARYARLAGAAVHEIPWGDAPYPAPQLARLVDPSTGLVALVSPNNPTGQIATVEDLHTVAATGALVLVDLAYVEFGDEALFRAALSLPNAVIIRTLSKAWGLAGLRVGYAIGPAEVIGGMRVAGAPYAVSGPSLYLAARWLDGGAAAMERFVSEVRRERVELEQELNRLGVRASPSEANFVFGRTPRALWVRDALAGLGIGVRAFPGKPGLEDALRITTPGEPEAHGRLLRALRAALRPEALLFDLDGVLADVSGSYRRAILETARHLGVEATGEDIAAIKHAGDANNDWVVTQRLLAMRGVDVPFAEVKARFEALYQGEEGRPGLRELERLLGDLEALARLASRLPLAIVTGRPRQDAWQFLERFSLTPFFREVIVMEDGPLKPDPAPVLLALRRLGVQSAWMIGDTPDDVRAARAAGVVPLGVVAPGERPEAAAPVLLAAGAARVLSSWQEIEALL